MKLHLGCGEHYLEGYLNIDYPPNQHTVQIKVVADQLVDLCDLSYPPETIDEIRLHHVFEHFPRAVACALLAIWQIWLKPMGILHIEAPDFPRTAWQILSPFSSTGQKMAAERHIFGSQEATWAVHYAGYSPQQLSNLLERYGYQVNKIKKNNWKGTNNFELIAEKKVVQISKEEFEKITRDYLGGFLIDDSQTEKRLLATWMKTYHDQFQKGVCYEKK